MGRFASQSSDWPEAAEFFSQALSAERSNPDFLRQAFVSHYLNGDIEQASLIAGLIEAENLTLAVASEPAAILAMQQGDYLAVRALSANLLADDQTRFMGRLLQSWALFADNQMGVALFFTGLLSITKVPIITVGI